MKGASDTRFFRWWISVFATAALMVFSEAAFAAGKWKMIRHNDQTYVSLNSVRDFYRFGKLEKKGDTLILRTKTIALRLRDGRDKLYINRILFNLSFPVIRKRTELFISRVDLSKLIDPVLRPRYNKDAEMFDTVVIDPGHGGTDSGAKGIFGVEKDYTLDLAKRLYRHLKRQKFKVVMTRKKDRSLKLEKRVKIANRFRNAIFISLHFNSSTSGNPKGIETFALTPHGVKSTNNRRLDPNDHVFFDGNLLDSSNIALATAVHAMVLRALKAEDRGVKRARWVVLKDLAMPGILLEGGFLSNQEEQWRIHSSAYREVMSRAITRAILNYRRTLGAARRRN